MPHPRRLRSRAEEAVAVVVHPFHRGRLRGVPRPPLVVARRVAQAIEDDDGLDMGLEDDDDELAGDEISMVPLEDFGDDQLDDDDSFDDGGFDYDEGDFGDFDGGGDAW